MSLNNKNILHIKQKITELKITLEKYRCWGCNRIFTLHVALTASQSFYSIPQPESCTCSISDRNYFSKSIFENGDPLPFSKFEKLFWLKHYNAVDIKKSKW